jgi:hypothetical protein
MACCSMCWVESVDHLLWLGASGRWWCRDEQLCLSRYPDRREAGRVAPAKVAVQGQERALEAKR